MLAGRDTERAAIAALLHAARTGTGGALVVRGVAGAGKSTLLADAVSAATDMRILRTQGVESESPLAFAALQRLLWPLRTRVEALPAPQRAALRAALGEAEGEGDRFLTFLGTLSLLADVADEEPVLVVVDDAHWLDDASAAALMFVARRLQAERVALLFAARDGSERRFDSEDLPVIAVGGVSGDAADALLRTRAAGDVDPAVRDQLVADTGGNPLALVELAGALTTEQLAGRDPLPAQLPLTGGVERALLDRYRRLSEPAQRLLLVAATDDTARLTVVRDAAERLDADEDALDEVERSDLLRVDGDELSLYHPLVRSAVYRAATSLRTGRSPTCWAPTPTGEPGTWPQPPIGPTTRSSRRSTRWPSAPPAAAATRRQPRPGPAPRSSPPAGRRGHVGCTPQHHRAGWARTRRERRRWRRLRRSTRRTPCFARSC